MMSSGFVSSVLSIGVVVHCREVVASSSSGVAACAPIPQGGHVRCHNVCVRSFCCIVVSGVHYSFSTGSG